jgi:hypothetical protein
MDRHVELVSDAFQLMLGFELFRVVESQAADREIDDFMTLPRSLKNYLNLSASCSAVPLKALKSMP